MISSKFNLRQYGLNVSDILRNASHARLYQEELCSNYGSAMASNGALLVYSGEKTGRSPKDKRIVEHPESVDEIWWGEINIKFSEEAFEQNRQRAIDCLNTRERLYVFDGFAGATSEYRRKVRVICARPYHALFIRNMLIRPSMEELKQFGEPDYVIFNAGVCAADEHVEGVESSTSVALFFERGEVVILGTEYGGEMKKGVFTIMNYLMPKQDVFPMHCSANEGEDGDVSLFFGLSGTGKTTLSTDPKRRIIGDDEHCWTDKGIFNIEGGCYAKCIDLDPEKEPDIWDAIRLGAVVENATYDQQTHDINYSDDSITENTRAAYPVEHLSNAKIPGVGAAPSNIIFLTCDSFGIMPPVCRLDSNQARYHFISGYTAKVAGTEQGIEEPVAAFSACFGAPFMVLPPIEYAQLLARKIEQHGTPVWLVNTGWSGGPYGEGERVALKHTRAMLDAIHSGDLQEVEYREDPVFGFAVPKQCPNVPVEILDPRQTWDNPELYDKKAQELAQRFRDNFEAFAQDCPEEVVQAGPRGEKVPHP